MNRNRWFAALLALFFCLSVPCGAVCAEAAWPVDDDETYARAYLAQMSLEERVGQLLLVCCHDSETLRGAVTFGVGGICLYANAFEGRDRDGVRQMIANVQAASRIPLIISVDEEGGSVCRVSSNPKLRSARFQSPSALYTAGGWELVESDTREKSALLLDLGINVNLAPVCDVPLSSSDYIYSRSFSTDAQSTAEYVRRVVRNMREMGIGATLKHFPGYGGSSDTHTGMARDDRPYSAFVESDLLPFAAGIAAGAESVLVSHNVVACMDSKYPASLSPEVHRILREELGFTGVIMTDALEMDAIGKHMDVGSAAVQALLAGNDLILCTDFESAAAAIFAAVDQGVISPERIDESVLRVLRWKRSFGLI